MEWLGCSLCEDPRLVLRVHRFGDGGHGWVMECGMGHEWVPIPGTVIVLAPPVTQAPTWT